MKNSASLFLHIGNGLKVTGQWSWLIMLFTTLSISVGTCAISKTQQQEIQKRDDVMILYSLAHDAIVSYESSLEWEWPRPGAEPVYKGKYIPGSSKVLELAKNNLDDARYFISTNEYEKARVSLNSILTLLRRSEPATPSWVWVLILPLVVAITIILAINRYKIGDALSKPFYSRASKQ